MVNRKNSDITSKEPEFGIVLRGWISLFPCFIAVGDIHADQFRASAFSILVAISQAERTLNADTPEVDGESTLVANAPVLGSSRIAIPSEQFAELSQYLLGVHVVDGENFTSFKGPATGVILVNIDAVI